MATQSVSGGDILIQSGQPLDSLHLIVNGEIKLRFPGGEMMLEKGDVIGLLELDYEAHCFTYEAVTDTSYITYPYANDKPIGNLFASSEDLANLFALSMFKQVCALLDHYEMTKYACSNLYQYINDSYNEYLELCTRYKVSPRALPDLENLEPLVLEDDIDYWLSNYYTTINKAISGKVPSFLNKNPWILSGMMIKASHDVRKTLTVCQMLSDYQADVSVLWLNESQLDFFDLYTSLLFRIGAQAQDSTAISAAISKLMIQLESEASIDRTLLSSRVSEYKTKLQMLEENGYAEEEITASEQDIASLKDSLETILDYAGCDAEVNTKFRKLLEDFKKQIDKNATDDKARKLRMEITKLFYQIYEHAFFNSLEDKKIPDVLMMFFLFGYVDEELAGMENAVFLRSLIRNIPSAPDHGIYTIYDWFQAIYYGRKEPSRNEFDSDYTAFIHEMKVSGKITEAKERTLLRDQKGKTAFEIENVFPLVNRMTFGRISTFCPVFSEHNILKDLSKSLVTADMVEKCFQNIRSADFSAYCREAIYTNPALGIGKEMVQVEVIPDVILMPNIGVRGVMWQEIEGRKRTTPARMMISIFHMEDLETILVRLTGEFRWELCRRIQGARWNDLSERSLTSEYCDYIQFYRKNRELSPEAKDKIKSSMQKAKNSYKEMFVRDYISWILFEGKGAPRLNRVSRNILFTYCPFSKEVRNVLAANPLFREILERYKVKNVQKLHHLENIEQKIKNSRGVIPAELVRQRAFLEK